MYDFGRVKQEILKSLFLIYFLQNALARMDLYYDVNIDIVDYKTEHGYR